MPQIRNPSPAEILASDAYFDSLDTARKAAFTLGEGNAMTERMALLSANSSRSRAFLEYRRALMTNAAYMAVAAELLDKAQEWYDLVPVANRIGSTAENALNYATLYSAAVERSSDFLAANPIAG